MPSGRTIIIDAGDRYYEGTFRWLPARITFSDTATLKNDWLPQIAQARQDPRVRGILIWTRFPVWDIHEVSNGVQVRIRDMRFRGMTRGGFTASTIVPH